MPLYEFECKKCAKSWSELCSMAAFDAGFPDVRCPECKSKKVEKLLSLCARIYNMDNFDVRAGRNLEKAKKERAAAEEASHVGGSPYTPIDDISGGEYFGEVK